MYLTHDQLEKIGINLGHRIKIINYIQKAYNIEKRDELMIDEGLILIGEAANIIMGLFEDKKSRSSDTLLKKFPHNKLIPFPEVVI